MSETTIANLIQTRTSAVKLQKKEFNEKPEPKFESDFDNEAVELTFGRFLAAKESEQRLIESEPWDDASDPDAASPRDVAFNWQVPMSLEVVANATLQNQMGLLSSALELIDGSDSLAADQVLSKNVNANLIPVGAEIGEKSAEPAQEIDGIKSQSSNQQKTVLWSTYDKVSDHNGKSDQFVGANSGDLPNDKLSDTSNLPTTTKPDVIPHGASTTSKGEVISSPVFTVQSQGIKSEQPAPESSIRIKQVQVIPVAPDGVTKVLRLKMEPAELGPILVRMKLGDSGLEMSLIAAKTETTKVLMADKSLIIDALKQSNLVSGRDISVVVTDRAVTSAGSVMSTSSNQPQSQHAQLAIGGGGQFTNQQMMGQGGDNSDTARSERENTSSLGSGHENESDFDDRQSSDYKRGDRRSLII